MLLTKLSASFGPIIQLLLSTFSERTTRILDLDENVSGEGGVLSESGLVNVSEY